MRFLALALLTTTVASACSDDAHEPLQAGELVLAAEDAQAAPTEAAAVVLPEPEGSLATGEMALGAEDAPLTVTEYASVTCPGCAAFHATYMPLMKEQLIEPGLVRFVYRELPTGPLELSYAGSILARCAATEAGAPAYFAVNDALFSRQREWVTNPSEVLPAIFAQVGMDKPAMQDCLRRGEIKVAIDQNADRAREAGVQGTPTLLVDGERVELTRDPQDAIDALRARAEAARG